MFREITCGVLQTIAGNVEKLLLKKQEGFASSYKKNEGGITISIGSNLDQSPYGVIANYAIYDPLDHVIGRKIGQDGIKRLFDNDIYSWISDGHDSFPFWFRCGICAEPGQGHKVSSARCSA